MGTFHYTYGGMEYSDGYSVEDRENGGNGYLPVSLQYRPYTAMKARECSIAGGDPREDFSNRSYRGKTNKTTNESDLDFLIEAKKKSPDKPVIVIVRMQNPMIMAELEPYADAIFVDFGFGMNWSGVIEDKRKARYVKKE